METISEWLVTYFDIIAVLLILSYCLGINSIYFYYLSFEQIIEAIQEANARS